MPDQQCVFLAVSVLFKAKLQSRENINLAAFAAAPFFFSLVLNIGLVMQYRRLLFSLCVLLCCTAIGQLSAQHITMANGLPSNVVYDVYEDSKGFIWFCTDQGISRYDGSAFYNYSIKDGIPDREVFRIKEDKQQRYWLICYNRKACYLKHGKVYTSENDALCKKIEAEGIAYDELFVDREGNDCLMGMKIGILRPRGGTVLMSDNFEVSVSQRKREEFLQSIRGRTSHKE